MIAKKWTSDITKESIVFSLAREWSKNKTLEQIYSIQSFTGLFLDQSETLLYW